MTTIARLVSVAVLPALVGCIASPEPRAGQEDRPEKEEGAPVNAPAPARSPSGDAQDRPRTGAVVFVHGTSDHGDVDGLQCTGTGGEDWRCVAPTAVAEYWSQPTIDSERKRPDGSMRPYAVVGCPLSAQTPWPNPTPVKPKRGPAEPGSAACVAAEIARFLDGPDGEANTADDVQDIAIITHSGGSNVVRYILQQHSARPTFARVHGAARGVVAIAAPSTGTYLADKVFRFGALSLGNKLFGAGYDDDGVEFIQTANMNAFNRDPAKLVDLSKDIAGVPAFMASGAISAEDDDPAKIACAGESETKGLGVLHSLYLDDDDPETFRNGCSDGFITCQSAMALAGGDASRVVFGMLGTTAIGRTHFRAHNQSRRDCDGLDVDVRAAVNEILRVGAKTQLAKQALFKKTRPLYVSALRSLEARGRGVLLEHARPLATHAGAMMRVAVHTEGDATDVRGYVRDPSGEVAHVSFERDQLTGSLFAAFRVPSDAPAGAWSMHVARNTAELGAHHEAVVPLAVTTSRGFIDDVTASRNDSGDVIVRVVARDDDHSLLGVRATLVNEVEADGVSWEVATHQMSSQADPSGRTVLTMTLQSPIHETHLVVRDVVLISHDDASTLDVRERVVVR